MFINDASTISSKNYSFKVPKDIMRIQVYGSKYYSYNMSFDILERKEKSFTLNLYNFSFYKNNYMSPLKAAEGSKLIVNSCLGDNKITGSNGNKPTSAIDCYDLKINVLSGSMLTVVGGNGSNGNNGTDSSSKSTRHGVDGTNGSTAIKCNSAILNTSNLTIVGGSGGNGGNGVNSGYYGGGNMDGGNGGNGGSAGSCIIYKTEVFVSPYVICETGKRGSGGSAGKQYIDAVGISWWGSPGTQGSSGRSAMAIVKNN